MRRLSFVVLLSAIAAGAACSLVNAPADVIAGGGGSSTTSGSGGGTCRVDGDCQVSEVPCVRYVCALGGVCQAATLIDGTTCDDGKHCTVNDACSDGKCVGEARVCPGKDACNVGSCNEDDDTCEIVASDGAACDDGNPCTEDGVCQGGVCTEGANACAKLSTECTKGICAKGIGCTTQDELDGTGCGMSFCSNGVCKFGHCEITPINEGKSCNDSLFCTVGDTCHGGFCVGTPNPCPTGDQCIRGVCDEDAKACAMVPIADNSPCDDGDACTANEFCSDDQCIGGLPPTTLFSETFENNAKGWELGPEWQIGHAAPSFGHEYGHSDPASDVTGDGFVAGVALGGNAIVALGNPIHAPHYLTSPPINTVLAGAIYLTFHRWLNSDYNEYMTNTVEISTDGESWNVLWAMGNVPVTDDAWEFQAFDITAYKSKNTRVRFGFAIVKDNVWRVSSWNIDNVKVQNAPCPQ